MGFFKYILAATLLATSTLQSGENKASHGLENIINKPNSSVPVYENIAPVDCDIEFRPVPESIDHSKINILLNAGHGPYDGIHTIAGTKADNLTEFLVAQRIAQLTRQILDQDPRFFSDMSKSFVNYRPELIKYMTENQSLLQKLVGEKKPINIRYNMLPVDDIPKKINEVNNFIIRIPEKDKDTFSAGAENYGEQQWAQEVGFDWKINFHMNYFWRSESPYDEGMEPIEAYPDSGFCIFISTTNHDWRTTTKKFAIRLGERLRTYNNVSSRITQFKNALKEGHVNDAERDSMLVYGVTPRILPQLGNDKLKSAIKNSRPVYSVTIEFEHMKKYKRDNLKNNIDYRSDPRLEQYAEAVYLTFLDIYNLRDIRIRKMPMIGLTLGQK